MRCSTARRPAAERRYLSTGRSSARPRDFRVRCLGQSRGREHEPSNREYVRRGPSTIGHLVSVGSAKYRPAMRTLRTLLVLATSALAATALAAPALAAVPADCAPDAWEPDGDFDFSASIAAPVTVGGTVTRGDLPGTERVPAHHCGARLRLLPVHRDRRQDLYRRDHRRGLQRSASVRRAACKSAASTGSTPTARARRSTA